MIRGTQPKETDMGVGKEIVELELLSAIREGKCITVIFKRKVTSAVVAALDSFSDMENEDRIRILPEDIEKMRHARFNGEWPAKDEKSRTISFEPGKLFKPSVFIATIEPAIHLIKACGRF